jgi:hypothetical protein
MVIRVKLHLYCLYDGKQPFVVLVQKAAKNHQKFQQIKRQLATGQLSDDRFFDPYFSLGADTRDGYDIISIFGRG